MPPWPRDWPKSSGPTGHIDVALVDQRDDLLDLMSRLERTDPLDVAIEVGPLIDRAKGRAKGRARA